MKNLFYALIYLSSNLIFAQFNVISQFSSQDGLEILAIDNLENSTLVHFKFSNMDYDWICASEKLYIENIESNIKYNSLRAINLPYCPNRHLLEKVKRHTILPLNLKKFHLILKYSILLKLNLMVN